jgi:hypothetical protein
MLPEHEKEIVTKGLVLHRTPEGLYAYQIEKQVGNTIHCDHAKNNSFKIIRVRLASPHIIAHIGIVPASAPSELLLSKTVTPLFHKTKGMSTLSELLAMLSAEKYKHLFKPLQNPHRLVNRTDANENLTDEDGYGSLSAEPIYGVDAGSVYTEHALQVMQLKKQLEELLKRKIKLI